MTKFDPSLPIEIWSQDKSWPMVKALQDRVYPAEIWDDLVWRDVESSYADKRVLILRDDHLQSVVGLYPRRASINGKPVNVIGIGGVMTDPDLRRSGLGSAAMNKARDIMVEQNDIDLGVLFCEPHNVPFYKSLGWRSFDGDVISEQQGKAIKYDIMGCMMLPVKQQVPEGGSFDTCGLPW